MPNDVKFMGPMMLCPLSPSATSPCILTVTGIMGGWSRPSCLQAGSGNTLDTFPAQLRANKHGAFPLVPVELSWAPVVTWWCREGTPTCRPSLYSSFVSTTLSLQGQGQISAVFLKRGFPGPSSATTAPSSVWFYKVFNKVFKLLFDSTLLIISLRYEHS